MTRQPLILAGLAAALSLALAGQASAHAHLIAAEPAVDSAGPAPAQLTLHFSEKLVARFSGLELTTAAGAPVPVAAVLGKDGASLTATPARPLSAGLYKVSWHVVSADAHRMTGAYAFTVR